MFDTYGPFVLKAHDGDSIDELFMHIKTVNLKLQFGSGVFIISSPDDKGVMIP
jgi:hypothetical protein